MYSPLYFLLCLALAFSTVWASPLAGDLVRRGGSLQFKGCSKNEITLLNRYLLDMQSLAQAAATQTLVPPVSNDAGFNAWWGSSQNGKHAISNSKINARFNKIANFVKNPLKDIVIDCGNTRGCTRTSSAATDHQRIIICPSFWQMPYRNIRALTPPPSYRQCEDVGNYRGVAAQLLHEVTHALFFTADEELPGRGRGSGYGHSNCLDLAKSNPAAARRNADSYAMFALAAYYGGVNKWSKTSDAICGAKLR